MSITQDFETRMGPLGDGGLYSKKDIDELLAYTRQGEILLDACKPKIDALRLERDALKAMLKSLEWIETEWGEERCPVCIKTRDDQGAHYPDCQLDKLISEPEQEMDCPTCGGTKELPSSPDGCPDVFHNRGIV